MNNVSAPVSNSGESIGPDCAVGSTGVVVIGRNEGERLHRCLQSLGTLQPRSVYVDSGSTDNSVALAREYGVAVVNLDMSEPFTAARARNVGFWNLLKLHPALDFVFFVHSYGPGPDD